MSVWWERFALRRQEKKPLDSDGHKLWLYDGAKIKFYLHSEPNTDHNMKAVNIITSLVYSLIKQQYFADSL